MFFCFRPFLANYIRLHFPVSPPWEPRGMFSMGIMTFGWWDEKLRSQIPITEILPNYLILWSGKNGQGKFWFCLRLKKKKIKDMTLYEARQWHYLGEKFPGRNRSPRRCMHGGGALLRSSQTEATGARESAACALFGRAFLDAPPAPCLPVRSQAQSFS